jgi:hypothetical protein
MEAVIVPITAIHPEFTCEFWMEAVSFLEKSSQKPHELFRILRKNLMRFLESSAKIRCAF